MAKSDRDISEWDKRLKEQIERGFKNYHVRRIDLSEARENKQLNWTGETLIVERASSKTAIAMVRLNYDDADELVLEENVEIKSIFGRLYLTNIVQAGQWLDLIAGINFEYKKKIDEAAVSGAGLPKTGQTILYQAGDDGDYEAGLDHDFEIQNIGGDDVVIDNATGLMWARDGNAAGGNNGAAINWSNGLIYAEGLTFAGFSDWRMPNLFEIESILDHSVNPGIYPEFINMHAIPGDYYWSSTTPVSDTDFAFVIAFMQLIRTAQPKLNTNYLLCLRGGL